MTTRPASVFAAVILCCTSAFAQSQSEAVPLPPPPPAKKLPQGSIAGHVYLADTRTPARGAHVTLVPMAVYDPPKPGVGSVSGMPSGCTTALDGSFLISHVGPGDYAVVALAAGYLSPLDGLPTIANDNAQESRAAVSKLLRETGMVVSINGSETARIEIELQRGAVLAGKVTYADGAPATQLPVTTEKIDPKVESLIKNSFNTGVALRTLLLQQRITTDDQGHFRISGIAPGSYRLGVVQSTSSGDDFGQELMALSNPTLKLEGIFTIYSGNTMHRKDAKVYDLKAGDSVDGIEIVLPLTGLHVVSGIAAAKDGMPLNSGVVDLTDTADTAIAFHVRLQKDGSFRIGGVPPGTYTLKASQGMIFADPPMIPMPQEYMKYTQQQYGPQRAFVDTSVSVVVQDTDTDNLTVTLPETKLPPMPEPPPMPPVVEQK